MGPGGVVAEKQLTRRATVHDVAREAGVSLATVDRVLNRRPGVRPATAGRVEEAIRALDFRRDLSASLLARARDLRIVFLITDGRNEFMQHLQSAVAGRVRAARAERITLDSRHVKPLDPDALAAALDGLDPRQCDCAVIVATDDKRVRKAVEAATRRGIPIVTLVSDLPGSARRHFVGIDNRAAGRTAASLLGRFCPSGKVGIIAGSLGLRDHAERFDGFSSVMSEEFPGHPLIGPVEGLDDNAVTEKRATAMLKQHPDLAGLYNVGAGNLGLMRALERSGRARDIRVVAHELAGPTRKGLLSGVIDVVLDQNPEGEVRAAIAAARSLALGASGDLRAEPIEIGIFLRDNLRPEGNPT
jgi:LacI family transcriptional regulator